MTTTRPHTNRDDVSELDRLRRLYESIHDSTTNGAPSPVVVERADALITALEAEVQRAKFQSYNELRQRAEQAEAEVALRDRMLRDIIERIALTPERWNGWTTEEVLTDLRARADEAER